MTFHLPELPFSSDALVPHMSSETLAYHHGKHHRAYVDKLNGLVAGTAWEGRSLEEIVRGAEGSILDNGAQHWNHSFFWRCLSPQAPARPGGALAAAIDRQWGSLGDFRKAFTDQALGLFGSGWAWLVQDGTDLAIVQTANAGNPLREGRTPLLTADVWEHAYYIDYRNERPRFLEAFWRLVDWEFVAERFGR